MTVLAHIAGPYWTLVECSQKLQQHRIHQVPAALPVVDANGNLIGMISATDIFRAAEEIGWGKY
jgi:CBS-domain-containing membrane protein